MTEVEELSGPVDVLTGQMTGWLEPRLHVEAMVTLLQAEMRENEQRGKALCRNRRDIVTQAQFAARCASRTMIRNAWERMECASNALYRHIGDIVAGREVPEMTNNEAFEADEEGVSLQAPATPVTICRHVRDGLRQMDDAEPFEGLPTVMPLENAEGD